MNAPAHPNSHQSQKAVSFIGFGEAAQAFTKGWAQSQIAEIRAFDVKSDADPDTARKKQAEYLVFAIVGCADIAGAVHQAQAIFSMVTADQALTAAQQAAKTIEKDALYFDCNSCAPATKIEAAKAIHAAGAHYVDVAIMAPVYPGLNKTPLLVSAPRHRQALAVLSELDMAATHAPGDIGTASSIKMVRSIMVKGLEALTLECMLAARTAGIDETVLQSLEKSYPEFGWSKRVPYMLERAMVHGNRRAEELREVAKTVEHLGLPNDMANAIVKWQQRIGDLNLTPVSEDGPELADQILKHQNFTTQSHSFDDESENA